MARDISIAITARDNFSAAITTMRNANQAFNKDLTGLQTKLDALNRTKYAIKGDTKKLREELLAAEKQFGKTGDAADKLKMEMAQADYENANRNLRLVSKNANQAEKDILSLTGAISKSENRAGRAGNAGTSIINSLAASGVAKMAGDVFGTIAMTRISSAYGEEAGTIANSVMSSGAMGAAIGTAIAPGIGTAIGALGGSLLGYLQGQNAIFEKKDDAFKSYYEDLYNDVLNIQNQALTSGISIASKREQDRIAFGTLLGGDNNATSFLDQIIDFAAATPFAYEGLTEISKTLLAYGFKQNELIPLLEKIGDAGSATGMSAEDMGYVAKALGRMQTTGKTTLEYINPLMERGIPVFDYLAEASGKTKEDVIEMVNKGLVPGAEAAKAIADYMGAEYAGNMEKQAKSYEGLLSTLQDVNAEMENAMGEGYTDSRKGGLQEQINWLDGESGEGMQDAYYKIGQWKASLENLSEQLQRDALNSVMSGTLASSFETSEQKEALERLISEYNNAEYILYGDGARFTSDSEKQKASAEMGRILAEAQAIATNEYNASEGAQLALESNKTLAKRIKNDSAAQEDYWDAGYAMGQQFTLGLVSGMNENRPLGEQHPNYAITGMTMEQAREIYMPNYPGATTRNHAYGLNFVPYDNYPALLHQGERVLTASENRSHNTKTPINITGNNFVIRSDDDIKGVAYEIAKLMERAYALAP